EDALVVLADPVRLAQVVTNLLTNAVKFTQDAGSIRLTVVEEPGQVVMRVQDTGIGITPEMLPHVFDMFAEAEISLDRSTGALTGYGTAEDKKRAAEAGFDYHLTKPADVEQLYRLVTKT